LGCAADIDKFLPKMQIFPVNSLYFRENGFETVSTQTGHTTNQSPYKLADLYLPNECTSFRGLARYETQYR